MHRFWDIRLQKCRDLENKVIENDTIQSGTHDFLLTFHSNHRPISHRFPDKGRFPSKIANFSHPVYLTPRWRGSPWNWVSAQGSEETRMMGLPDGRKSFKIGLAVLIQYRRVTDTQPATHSPSQPRCRSIYRAYYVVRVKNDLTVYTHGPISRQVNDGITQD